MRNSVGDFIDDCLWSGLNSFWRGRTHYMQILKGFSATASRMAAKYRVACLIWRVNSVWCKGCWSFFLYEEALWVWAVQQHVLFRLSHPVQMELPPQTHHPDHQMIWHVDPQHRMFLAIQCGGRLVVWIVGWWGLLSMLVGAFLPPVGTPHEGPFEGASTDPEHQFYSRISDENNSRRNAETYCLSSIDTARSSHREPTPVRWVESDADLASKCTCWVPIISIAWGTSNRRRSADMISCSHFFCATAEIVDDNWV